jgi:glutathione S-transferase
MSELTLWTWDWVPKGPRGYVRDLRLKQPFGQVPFMTDDGIEMLESGAGLLHLARKSEVLMPRDPVGEAQTL